MKGDIKKNNQNKKNRVSSGFTLIELLAVIAILSVIMSIVVYFISDIVKNSKGKSYQVTVNNVQSQANNYVMEDLSDNDWMDGVSGSYQYQCVTVQDLIDTGYFKGDVLESMVAENKYLQATDYIYLERNKNNKSITKNVLLLDSSYSAYCNNVTALITMSVDKTGWAKEKNVTINYYLNNISDTSMLANYDYEYSFYAETSSKTFDSKTEKDVVNAEQNGYVYAYIKDASGNIIAANTLKIDKIDNTPPIGIIKSKNYVLNKQSVSLELSDTQSGVVEYYFGQTNPELNTVSWKSITNTKSITLSDEVSNSGKWYLGARDLAGNVSYVNEAFYETKLVVNNATVTPSSIMTMNGDSFVVPEAIPNENYVFVGWYDNSSYSGSVITTYKPTSDGTLYGKTDMNNFTVNINYSTNGGSVVSPTTGADGVTIYNWSSGSDGLISLNGSLLTTKVGYDKELTSDGLIDWDNSTYLKITKTGHSAANLKEWICLSGDCKGDTFSDSVVYKGSDFCDASSGDCTVVLGPNWKVNTYTITYDANGGYSGRAEYERTYDYCTYEPTKENHDVKGTMTSQTCTYGESCTLKANAFDRQCHKFKGWTTNEDTDTVNYTNKITGDDDTDAFYANKDTFVYNIDGDITLYAVWENDHDFTAIGNQVVHTDDNEFTCGHIHYKYGAYVRYCQKCHMSAAHYDVCYRPVYSTGDYANHLCPCNSGLGQLTLDDHSQFYSSMNTLDRANWLKAYRFGGLAEGGKTMTVVGEGNLAALVCGNHTTYVVSFDTQGGSGSTSKVYGVYNLGLFLELDSSHGAYSKKMTTSSNKITVPTKSGYTFRGYYTEVNGGGSQIINASGYLTSNYSKTSYTSDFTLYAKWIA